MSYKTIPDADDGFGDRTQACREYTVPRANSDSRIYATIPGQTFIGPVLQVHVIHYLGINGIEIQIPSTNNARENLLGSDMPREEPLRGEVTSQRSRPQSHKFWPAVGKIGRKRKKTWFCRDGAFNEHRGNSCEAVRNSDESSVQLFRRSYSYWRKEVEWHSCLQTFQSKYFWSRSLKIGHEMGCHHDQNERETDGAVHGNSMGPKLRKAFRKAGGQKFLDWDWLRIHLWRKQQNEDSVLRECQ